jgi:acyl-CoA reductase-like NAD-dependent aldehyde dehydrogenase
MRSCEHFYIDGRWQSPAGNERIEVRSAATEDVIGHVPRGTAEDVDRAVAAARRAFDGGWALTEPAERAEWLRKLATALEARVPQIAETISREVGMPITMSTTIQAQLPVTTARTYTQLATELNLDEQIGNSIVAREPFGVAGMITPWNYPLHQIMAKVAPALAAGCTMVLKPSEVAPLNSYLLAEAALDAGLPPGVLNIVHGDGPTVGEAIAQHPGVDMISFTGSIGAGQRVGTLAAATIKKVTLELGGKSAFIVLDDAPLEKAVPRGVNNAMLNSGQTCSAWTRMIVPRARVSEVLEIASGALAKLKIGDPLDPEAKLGPLVSSGHYVEPTIFANVGARMTIAQEEIFGPVLVVLPYDTEDEAIAIANDTIYGLAGGVWGADRERALRVARRMRTGQVDVNGARFNPLAPFGGYKWSGVGREFGKYGLEEYLQIKAIQC